MYLSETTSTPHATWTRTILEAVGATALATVGQRRCGRRGLSPPHFGTYTVSPTVTVTAREINDDAGTGSSGLGDFPEESICKQAQHGSIRIKLKCTAADYMTHYG